MKIGFLKIFVIIVLVVTTAMAQKFAGGDGTAEKPYIIKTAEQLSFLNGEGDEGKHFKLAANIDLNGSPTNQWKPIGRTEQQRFIFRGIFDGNGYVISGLYIDNDSTFQGLFGYLGHQAKIMNLGITDSYVKARRMFGILAGYNGGEITNCYVSNSTVGIGDKTDGDTTINGIECVLVKAGSFITSGGVTVAGYTNYENGVTVTITKDFWISKYEITQEQYEKVMGNNPSWYNGNRKQSNGDYIDYGYIGNRPVEQLTWYNANDFCAAVGGQLPTEAEWEFAARGGNKSRDYKFSGSNNINEIAWYRMNVSGDKDGYNQNRTQVVGQLLPNELGIYDMAGNVYEWVSDWGDMYNSFPTGTIDPTGKANGIPTEKMARGGYWGLGAIYDNKDFENSKRWRFYPSGQSTPINIGVRVIFPRN